MFHVFKNRGCFLWKKAAWNAKQIRLKSPFSIELFFHDSYCNSFEKGASLLDQWPARLPGLRWPMACSSQQPSLYLLPLLCVLRVSLSFLHPLLDFLLAIVSWKTAFPVKLPPVPDHQVPPCDEQTRLPFNVYNDWLWDGKADGTLIYLASLYLCISAPLPVK